MINGWTVDLLPTTKPPFDQPPIPGPEAQEVKVFVFTDPHIDLTYTVSFPNILKENALR